MGMTFHCYEFLLLKKLQEDDGFWREMKERIGRNGVDSYKPSDIPSSLWFLSITLQEAKEKFLSHVDSEIARDQCVAVRGPGETMLSSYLNANAFVELRLDSVFKYGESPTLPRELFCCPNVRLLSLKYNYLEWIPADIGRMTCLEHLALTNNKLQNSSIPFTLVFCRRLRVLLLDNNLLDALPGFLLQMSSLQTVHRHGNHNYFKATFMWYHTDVNERILHVGGFHSGSVPLLAIDRLQFLSARSVISAKFDFFSSQTLPRPLKDYISDIYTKFSICDNCHTARLLNESGYKVYTFKNPYLGNTCVPFQHWACSFDCAKAIEGPARFEQMKASLEQDREYAKYVQEAQVKSGCRPRDSPPSAFGCVLL